MPTAVIYKTECNIRKQINTPAENFGVFHMSSGELNKSLKKYTFK